MGMHRKAGRYRAVVAVAILATGTLAALPASARPAVAEDVCTPSESSPLSIWRTISSARGVTLC